MRPSRIATRRSDFFRRTGRLGYRKAGLLQQIGLDFSLGCGIRVSGQYRLREEGERPLHLVARLCATVCLRQPADGEGSGRDIIRLLLSSDGSGLHLVWPHREDW
jgi:hypothetical protein